MGDAKGRWRREERLRYHKSRKISIAGNDDGSNGSPTPLDLPAEFGHLGGLSLVPANLIA
jgi:hypothetical protein